MEYFADPLSRRQVRAIAFNFRRLFGLEKAIYFPVVEVLEVMHLLFHDFHCEIVMMHEFQNIRAHAETDIAGSCIKIREDVYEGACEGKGRDRMTIGHEMGHFVTLKSCDVKLYRQFGGKAAKAYRDPEWQAKCFAGELLIPKHLVVGMNAKEVAGFCGVSREAAEYQLKKFKEEVIRQCSKQQKDGFPELPLIIPESLDAFSSPPVSASDRLGGQERKQ